MKSKIIEELTKYIKEEMLKNSRRELSPDQPLISSGIIDSFSLVDLSIFIEESYNVVVDDAELNADTFDSIEQLASLVMERMQ